MGKWKIGVLVDNLEIGIMPGIEKAAELGADGIQVYCVEGEMAPANMGAAKRKAFKKRLADLKLTLAALCGDTGRGFFKPELIDLQIKDAKAFMDLATDLGTNVVTTHFGRFPKDEKDAAWGMCFEALRKIGEYGASKGVYYASETGLEQPAGLLEFLKKVDHPNIKVNYDPANLAYQGFDQIGGVKILKGYIVHTHAKDYKRAGEETLLGKGDVNFPEYLKALSASGYNGFLTIEREEGNTRVEDVAAGIKFLRTF